MNVAMLRTEAGRDPHNKELHDLVGELSVENIHVGQLIIPGAISPGHPTQDPAALADILWAMHARRDQFRVFAETMDLD